MLLSQVKRAGSAINYLTFIVGNGGDESQTQSRWMPRSAVIAGTAGQGAHGQCHSIVLQGGRRPFVAKLLPSWAVTFSTYLGGAVMTCAGRSLDSEGAIILPDLQIQPTFPRDAAPINNAGGRDISSPK